MAGIFCSLFPPFLAYEKLEVSVKEKISITIVRLGIKFVL